MPVFPQFAFMASTWMALIHIHTYLYIYTHTHIYIRTCRCTVPHCKGIDEDVPPSTDIHPVKLLQVTLRWIKQ